ncbi:521_t:CDS:10 [Acaulospora morrowiae]|uniref:Eukaryotic translation initiation factor 3 subunit D n=1 Tax=Acaulospora morrowiae TaxID=94023 RepID=A0A9N9EIH6_9GLOM|nr:521_t:CDS:10 [Acaulospora morrowiae]
MGEPTFTLPEIIDNENGWGPSPAMLTEKFRDIPYAPYSKSDKLGKIADWSTPEQKEKESTGRQRQGYRFREQYTAYGHGASSTFTYTHAEDEASFSVVDNRSAAQKKAASYRTTGSTKARGANRNQQQQRQQRNGQYQRLGAMNRGLTGSKANNSNVRRRFGWKDYDKNQRTRDASVTVGPEWKVLEEIEFNRLSKLNLDVDEGDDISSHGFLYHYDKSYDKVTTKTEKPLVPSERFRLFVSASEDPIIEQLARDDEATVFSTDAVLSMLMCAPRSVYPWDIIIIRTGNKLFFDRRKGVYDYITVNENAADPPIETGDKDNINSPNSLSLEAIDINHYFSVQVLNEAERYDFKKQNPFINSSEDIEIMAPCAYRYRRFDLSIKEEEDISLIVRTQLDSVVKQPSGDSFITIKALNEFDSRAQGAGGSLDWRQKLDTQRGAVVATEMKNNSFKLARWAVQSILAGADQMKLGYVSRVNPKDRTRHAILGTQMSKPRDFAAQMNLSISNGWGIVRTIIDICMKLPEGKYVLIKDPNKPVVRLYSVPLNTFETEDDVLDDGEDIDEEEEEIIEK